MIWGSVVHAKQNTVIETTVNCCRQVQDLDLHCSTVLLMGIYRCMTAAACWHIIGRLRQSATDDDRAKLIAFNL